MVGLSRRGGFLALASFAILLSVTLITAAQHFESARTARGWARHSREVMDVARDVIAAIQSIEAAERGYLLTGGDQFLRNYDTDLGAIAVLQDRLQYLTANNPAQQQRLRNIAGLIQAKTIELAESIQRRQRLAGPPTTSIAQGDLGQNATDNLAAEVKGFLSDEGQLLRSRLDKAYDMDALALWLALVGVLAALGLAIFAACNLLTEQGRMVRANAAQRALAGQLRTSLDSISQGMAVFGPEHHLECWNECFPELLGVPQPMMRQGTPYEAIAEQAAVAGGTNSFLDGAIRAEAQCNPPEPIVCEYTRPFDQRNFEIRRTSMPSGGFVLMVTEITERVRAEATARDAQRLQVIGQLTGGIAHDFNNLLTVVLMNLELAMSRLDGDSPILARIERAKSGAQRGATLVQHLLAFARKQPLLPRPVDLRSTVADIAGLMRRTLGANVDLQVLVRPNPWPAMADAVQLESALLNLALNSRDAMPDGGRITMEVENKLLGIEYARRHHEVTAGEYVMLAVSDTGVGMEPEVLARVFEPYFTTKEVGKGTGLGLPMVYGFAKQSGGHVTVCSTPGRGTTVRLYLPRAMGSVVCESECEGAGAALPRGCGTVLVVEDEDAVREVTVTRLRGLGYRVLQAATGPEALKVFGENNAAVDLLLTDVMLPGGIPGPDLARRIAEIRPEAQALYMSGHGKAALVEQGHLSEAAELIAKPFSGEALAQRILELLGQQPTSPPPDGGKVVRLADRVSIFESP